MPNPLRPIVLRWAGGRWVSTAFADAGTGERWEEPRLVAGDGANDAWLVTQRVEGDAGITTVRRWDPAARVWNRVPYELRDDRGYTLGITGITAAGGTAFLLVRGQFDGVDVTRVATWDGSGWTFLPDLPVPSYADDIDASSRDDVWVSGIDGVYRWDGSRWTNRTPDGEFLTGPVTVAAPDGVWMNGARRPAAGGPLARVLAHWDGASWTEHVVSAPAVGSPVVDSAGSVWLTAVSDKPDRSRYVRFTGSAFETVEGPARRDGIDVDLRDLVVLPGLAEPMAVGMATVLGSPQTATSEIRRPNRR